MKTLILSILVAAAALEAAPAAAQSFNGPSIGLQGGWQEEKISNPTIIAGVARIDASRDAAVGGVFAGYDHQLGSRVVIGLEGGFSIASSDRIRGSAASTAVQVDPKYSFDATARAGYLVTPETLLYVRGGYANERVRTTVTSKLLTATATENRDGWLVGGGVERLLAANVSARLEYRYTDLGSRGRYDRHQVLAGIAYRF
jgi:outer membrane immunogenic protein